VNCPAKAQRFFASDNSRGTRRLNAAGNWGYDLLETDEAGMEVEILNSSDEEKHVYVAVHYEYMEDSVAKDKNYKLATPLWLDISTGCGKATLPSPKEGSSKYSYKYTWTSTIGGKWLEAGAYMADGGLDSTIFVNREPLCRSALVYGGEQSYVHDDSDLKDRAEILGSQAYNDPEALGLNDDAELNGQGLTAEEAKGEGLEKHVSEEGLCLNFGRVEVGDEVQMISNFDENLRVQGWGVHERMPVKGVVLAYVGSDMEA
jgi:hypothetical protein